MNDYDRWESRYSVPEYIFGTAPNHFLVSCKSLLPGRGRALAVADGEGRNGVWLAEQGLDVLSLDFSPSAQAKAKRWAREKGVNVTFEQGDVHLWTYPEAAFDLVVEIFTQFSGPLERAMKWAGMRKALKKGGVLIIQGYTPKQLEYGTGGPNEIEKLYTRDMLESAFGDLNDVRILEEEIDMHEGERHRGRSAVIGLTARR